jgi:hypothetical protein
MTLKRFDVFESEKSQSFEFGTAVDPDLPSDRQMTLAKESRHCERPTKASK